MKHVVLFMLTFVISFVETYSQNVIYYRSGTKSAVRKEAAMPIRTVTNMSDRINVEYTFDCAIETRMESANVDYSILRIKGFGTNMQLGKPQLPGYTDFVAIKTKEADINIVQSQYVEFSDYEIYPAQLPCTDNDSSVSQELLVVDSVVYNTNRFYPENVVELQDVQEYRGTQMALIRVNPIQYNPVTKKIRCYTNISYEVENALCDKPAALAASNTNDSIFYSTVQEKYIIVTIDKYLDVIGDFVAWKKQLGFKTVVISKDAWSDCEEVKDSIRHEYFKNDNSLAKYLLIIGGAYEVPADYIYRTKSFQGQIREASYITDHYYSCMGDSTDYIPELARGRIPAVFCNEAKDALDKIIRYQQEPSFRGKGLHCAQFEHISSNDSTMERLRCILTSEEIRDYMINMNFNVARVYKAGPSDNPLKYNTKDYSGIEDIPEELHKPNYSWNGNASDIIASMEEGVDYVLYEGHGADDSWEAPAFSSSNLTSISQQDLHPVVFSIACQTGKYGNASNNRITHNNCLARSFLMKKDKGAVGVFAATETSYAGPNDIFVEAMFTAMFPSPGLTPNVGKWFSYMFDYTSKDYDIYPQTFSMGDVLNLGFMRLIQCIDMKNFSKQRFNNAGDTFQLFHYFGDPSMEINMTEREDLTNVEVCVVNENKLEINTNGIENCTVILSPVSSGGNATFQMAKHVSGGYSFEIVDEPYDISILKNGCSPCFCNTDSVDRFIQNKQITGTSNCEGRNFYIGNNVRSGWEEGNVVIKNNGHLYIKAQKEVIIPSGFECEKGGVLEIR